MGPSPFSGAGQQIHSTPDNFHFTYLPLTGDGSIVARVASVSGSSSATAAVMIRETLNGGALDANVSFYPSSSYLYYRSAVNGSGGNYQNGSAMGVSAAPYWLKVVRSGNLFTGYMSSDGLNWSPTGASVTLNMGQSAYIGLAVCGASTTALATATFDNVSVTSATAIAPIITSISATSASVGSLVGINGANFGASQGSSFVALNGSIATIDSWSDSSIVMIVPPGATSGHLQVTVGPSMDVSNFVNFTVTVNPLPVGWLDQDVGIVGVTGSATYANGTFTVKWSGSEYQHYGRRFSLCVLTIGR